MREGAGAAEGASAPLGLGGSAAPCVRAGRVRVREVWWQAPGAGVPDGIRRGARRSGAPGIALSACAAGCSAGATPKRVVLSQSSGCCCQHPCWPHPVPRRAWQGGLGWAGVCPLEMNGFCVGPACGSWFTPQG